MTCREVNYDMKVMFLGKQFLLELKCKLPNTVIILNIPKKMCLNIYL